MKIRIVFCLILLFSISFTSNAQFVEDAVRFISPNSAPSVRAASLGIAFFGFSDDGTALLTNPAGITLIPVAEFGFGMNLTNHKTSTDFFGNTKKEKDNEFYFTNVNFIFPTFNNYDYYNNEFEVDKNNFNFKFGFDYHLDNDFTNNTAFSGFNPFNTFIAQQAREKREWVPYVGLADSNYNTLIQNNIYQDGFVYEDGGLHNFSLGFGMDFDQTFAMGATFSMKFGTYDYSRKYFETDKDNLHNTYKVDDIDQLIVREKLTQELFGITGIVGFQARLSQYCRLGLAVKFPTLLIDSEYFAVNYDVLYDVAEGSFAGDKAKYSTGNMTNVYDIITPFEFTLGLSGNIWGLSYSISGSMLNAANTYFSISDRNIDMGYSDLLFFDELNELIEQTLTMQYTFGMGLEYKIPASPLYLRCSYTMQTSPYKDKTLCGDNNIIGAGLGLILTNNFIMDAAFVYSTQDYRRANYGNDSVPQLASFYDVKHTPTSFMLGFRYRFN
jgi:hypothetical protein